MNKDEILQESWVDHVGEENSNGPIDYDFSEGFRYAWEARQEEIDKLKIVIEYYKGLD